MPLAFPGDAAYQGYSHHPQTSGYYPNEDSEVVTSYGPTPQAPGPHDIIIDPALLNDSHMHQQHHQVHYAFEPNGQYMPQHYEPPPIGHLQHQPYHGHPPYEAHQQPQQPYPPAPYYQPEPAPYPPVYSEPVHYDHQPQPIPEPEPEPAPEQPTVQPAPVGTRRGRPSKKRPPREETCSFCQGSDENNAHGAPEAMASCYKCGRSGHPSCLKIEQIGDVIRNYDWTCMECKTCEVCRKKGQKGREDEFLFCDMCDRGWHTYCLVPPLTEPPNGTWACPVCVPQVAEGSSTIRRSASLTTSPQPLREGSQLNGAEPMEVEVNESEPMPTPVEETPITPIEPQPADPPKPKVKKVRVRQKKVTDLPARQTPDIVASAEAATEPQPQPVPLPPSPTRSLSQQAQKAKVRLKIGKGKRGRPRIHIEDEEPGPYDGILEGSDGDVSKTAVTQDDKSRFENARSAAETRIGPPNVFTVAPSTSAGTPGPSYTPRTDSLDPDLLPPNVRPLRSLASHLHLHEVASTSSRLSTTFEKGKWVEPPTAKSAQPVTGPSRIRTIRFGEFEIDTWYDAPFPEEYASVPDGMLWICEFCLKYMKSRFSAGRHRLKCKARHPPGDEIYRDDTVSVFEVDGRKNKIYCQNLCLLSKMFLDHKSLFYDVEPFLFYVMTETDDVGARFIGYFSKEKRSPKEYNLSCIMTLPVRQKKGYGNFLIDFSYLLSKKEGRIGGPETPLSALGALSYKRYRTLSIMYYLRSNPTNVTLPGMSAETSMTVEDIYVTLLANDMITSYDDARGRDGRNSSARPRAGRIGRTPGSVPRRKDSRKQSGFAGQSTDDGSSILIPRLYRIKWDPEVVEKYIRDWEARAYLRVNPEKLKWSPFLLGRSQEVNDAIDGVSPSTALVETMVRQADEESARLEVDLARIDQEKEEVQSPDEMQIDYRPERSGRRGSGFIPTKTPRTRTTSLAGSVTRTRSRRDLIETGSRASRSRVVSEDEAADVSGPRSSRRLRTRKSESHLKTPKYSFRTRKPEHDSESEFDEVASEASGSRRNLRRRTASAAASSLDYGHESGEESDAVPSAADEDETEDEEPELEEEEEEEEEAVKEKVSRTRNRRSIVTAATRPLRARQSKSTPNGKVRATSLRRRHSPTPNGAPRKRRRIQSSDEEEEEEEEEKEKEVVEAPARRSRASRNQAQPQPAEEVVETPVKSSRLRTRRSVAQTQTPDGQTPPKVRRGRPPKRPPVVPESDNDAEAEAQVEDAVQGNDRSQRTSKGKAPMSNGASSHPVLDFESTGSLSSLGPEPTEDDEIAGEEEAIVPETRGATKSATKSPADDPLLLLATAADYVGPSQGASKGNESEAEEMDAEGEEDWS